ncbi:glycosyltransferase family A protein [Microbacterium terrisoli]|jgi:glycosyltransferase involved in cell wall biosynthesis|uniref:glycosyltransferase family A protein n=1 Tax=Microbacterium terrisoli TaxID=3242192 RepID=UPI002805C96C|nr:glycosyltransferase family A protein [Microbacterium protaetiae]
MMEPAASKPIVSIIVALGRDSAYLDEALRSVREQTFQNWDLLIVDNGSRHPERVASAIADDARMKMITIDRSATAGLARNIGVAQTSADLITFLDDDDVWERRRLEHHVAVHRKHPEAPASFSGYWHMTATGEQFGADWRSRQTTASEILRGAAPTPLGPTLMIRRADFTAIGGHSPEIPILVDFELGLRLAMRGDLIYLDELLVGYRRHDTNMTSTAPSNVRLRRRAMEDMIKRQQWAALGRNSPDTASLFEERLRRFWRSETHEAGAEVPRALRRGRIADAGKSAAWAIRRDPVSFMTGVFDTVASALVRRAR